MPRARRIALDLRPQAPHVDGHGIRIARIRIVPHCVHELIAREHLAGVPREVEEEVELTGCELDGAEAVLHGPRSPIDAQVVDANCVAVDAAANVIGITPADIHTGLKGGKSLTEIAGANGVSRDSLKAGLHQRLQTGIAQAAANDKITQAQADMLLKGLDRHIDRLIDGKRGQGNAGGRRGPGTQGAPGGPQGNPQAPVSPQGTRY